MIAVYLEGGRVSVRETAVPPRSNGFVRIRMLVAGICNTDLELQRGYYGFTGIPGHEFVGEVVDADDAQLAGRRVTGEINLACGDCDFCHAGLRRHCRYRTVLGIVKHPGAFAEYVLLPATNLHVIPDEITSEQAVFIEPLAAACEILDQVRIDRGESVAVLGDGKLGLLIAQVMQIHGASVTLFGRHEEKLQIARAAGVEVSTSNERPRARFPFVIDATGSASGLKEAIAMVRPRGTVVMKSTIHGEVSIDTAPVIVNEVTLVGSRCGRFEPAIAILRSGKANVNDMISATFPLCEAATAFAEAAKPGILKVLLRNDQGKCAS